MTDHNAKTPPATEAPEELDRSGSTVVRIRSFAARNRALVAVAAVAVVLLLGALVVMMRDTGAKSGSETAPAQDHKGGESAEEHGAGEVELSPSQVEAAKIEIEGVTERVAVAPLAVTGTVESNQQQTQQVTPLVSGRVERVYVSLGDVVREGSPLAVIASPEVAEMHGKLLEAETRRSLAERNLARVQKAENRAGVLAAKAKLDEAQATLTRTQKLVELGAGAGKDLISAEAAYTTAKAEYDYQSSIALSREVQEAQAELDTATTEAAHLRQSLRALGDTGAEAANASGHDVSLVTLRAPIAGSIIERQVNAGAGIQAGSPIITIGNLSTVWVIANVPEAQVGFLRAGGPAEIRSAAMGSEALAGNVSYIDPRLDEQTRTARVRIDVANPGGRLKVGMFVQVGFEGASPAGDGPTEREIVVSSEAVQRVGERTVVFVPADEPGRFTVRDVELGGEVGGYRRVLSGLAVGDKVVTKGSFTLKTQLMKGELGEE